MKNYQYHLSSRHFKLQKKIAYYLAFKRCLICWQRYHLEPHHLWYGCLGKWYEFLFLRYVCDSHHEKVGTFLGKRLYKGIPLHLNYYRVKIGYMITVGVLRVVKWIIASYGLPSHR